MPTAEATIGGWAPAPAASPPRRRRLPGWALPVAVAAPYLVLLLRFVVHRRRTVLTSDWALLHIDALRAAHFAQALGPYDRFGWHHPGPIAAYLMAMGNAALGNTRPLQSEAVVALLVNGAAVAGMVLVARRVSGRAAAAGSVLAAMALIASLHADALFNPWSPALTPLPLALMGMLVVACWCRPSGAALASAALVGTWAVQTDIGTVPLAAALLLAGAAALIHQRRTAPERRAPGQANRVLPGVLVVITVAWWVPPLLQQISGRPGNLSSIVSFFLAHPSHAGLLTGLRAAGWAQLGLIHLPPPAVTPSGAGGMLAALGAIALAGALTVAGAHRRDRFVTAAGGVWLGGTVVATVAGAEIIGTPYSYLTAWAVAPAVVGVSGAAVMASHMVPAVHGHRARLAGLGLALAAVAATTFGQLFSPTISAMAKRPMTQAWQLVAHLRSGGPVGLAYGDDGSSWSIGSGLADAFLSAGRPVRVTPAWAFQVGTDHIGPAPEWVVIVPRAAALPRGYAPLGTAGDVRLGVSDRPPAGW